MNFIENILDYIDNLMEQCIQWFENIFSVKRNTGVRSADKYTSYTDFCGKSKNVKSSEKTDVSKAPFLMAYSLLTQAEMNFYKVLITVVDREKYTICPKVRMIDVLWMKTYKTANKQAFFNKIVRKHFDFVVCYADSLKPVYAIELDDKTHQWEERKERDEFVDSLFESLNFNVIHIPVQYSYNVEELKNKLGVVQSVDSEENL